MPDFHIPNDPEWQWAYDLILYGVGEEFPKADPAVLRAMGDELYGFTSTLLNGMALTASLAGTVSNHLNGPAADAFNRFSGDITKNLPAGGDISTALGGAANEFALQAESAQYNVIIAAFTQVVEIAIALASGFGAAAVPGLITMGQEIVKTLIDLLKLSLNDILARLSGGALFEGLEELWQGAAAQVTQILEGNRKGLDYNDLALSFGGGVFIGGGVTGLHLIGGKFFPNLNKNVFSREGLSGLGETFFEGMFTMMAGGGGFNPFATFTSAILGGMAQHHADQFGHQFTNPQTKALPPPPATDPGGTAGVSPTSPRSPEGPPVPTAQGSGAGSTHLRRDPAADPITGPSTSPAPVSAVGTMPAPVPGAGGEQPGQAFAPTPGGGISRAGGATTGMNVVASPAPVTGGLPGFDSSTSGPVHSAVDRSPSGAPGTSSLPSAIPPALGQPAINPSTGQPTAPSGPTTLGPTTPGLTTLGPTTLDPTTLDPATLDPATPDPTTPDPTTLGPTSQAPVAQASISQPAAPGTQPAGAVDSPGAQAPMGERPAEAGPPATVPTTQSTVVERAAVESQVAAGSPPPVQPTLAVPPPVGPEAAVIPGPAVHAPGTEVSAVADPAPEGFGGGVPATAPSPATQNAPEPATAPRSRRPTTAPADTVQPEPHRRPEPVEAAEPPDWMDRLIHATPAQIDRSEAQSLPVPQVPEPAVEPAPDQRPEPGDDSPALTGPPDPILSLSDVPPAMVAKSTRETPCVADPIDVTTGRMIYAETDATLPGLTLERTHRSDYRWGRSFGRTWASTLDQRIVADDRHARFLAADGSILTYPMPAEGDEAWPLLGRPVPLRRLVGGGWLLTDRDAVLLFAPGPDAGEALLADVASAGVRWHVDRADDGMPARLVSSSGDVVELTSAEGLVTGARFLPADPGDDVVELPGLAYDERRNLVEVRNSSGDSVRLRYDDAGRIVRWEDRNGEWYTYAYDEWGRCVLAGGNGGHLRYAFEYGEGVTVVTDSLGGVHRFELNDRRQVAAVVDPLGGITRTEWDVANRLLSRTDPLGRVTRIAYDERGRPVGLTRPDGSRTSVAYDENGVTPVSGERTEGVPDRVFDLDGLGRARSVRHPDGTTARFGWTAEGDLAWRVGPDGATRQWHYDGEGNLVESIDAVGRAARFEYGPFDLPLARIDEAGNRTEFGYDTELRLTTVTNPAGQVWRYRYDAGGRLAEETDFDGRGQRYTHDAAGQLTAYTNPAGETTHYGYDVLGRVTERRVGDTVTRLEYDAQGRIVAALTPDAVVRFERDERGRVVAETINGRTVRTSYHAELGTVEAHTTPSGRLSRWTFDAHGRPESLATGRHLVRFEHDAAGREISRTVDGVVALRQTFDAAGRLAAQHIAGSTEHGFFYDASDRVTAIVDPVAGDRSFDADELGQIRAVATGDGQTERYDYDAAGNLVGTGGGRWEFDGTMLVRSDEATFSYDDKGRLITRVDPAGVWRFAWDAGDRLVQAVTPGGDRWRYRYDGFGRRIAKQRLTDDGTVLEEVHFAWAGDLMVEQSHRDTTGTTTTTSWEYRPGDLAPVTQTDGDALHAVITDLIGTPTHLVAADGALSWWSRGDLWGGQRPRRRGASDQAAAAHQPRGHSPDPGATPLRFPGQYFDAETGLHYNRFRFYDPSTARYLSPDPLGLSGGPNPTAYVRDPLTVADPLGLTSCKVTAPSLSSNPSGISNPALPSAPDGQPTQLPNRAVPPSPEALYGTPQPTNTSPASPAQHAANWYSEAGQVSQSPLAQLPSSQSPTLASVQQQMQPLPDRSPRTDGTSDRGARDWAARRRGTGNVPGGAKFGRTGGPASRPMAAAAGGIGISKERLVEEQFTAKGREFPVVNPHAGEEDYLQNCVDSMLAMYEVFAGHGQRTALPGGPVNAESLDRVLDWLSDHRTVDVPDYDAVARAMADAPVLAQGFLRVTTPDSRDGHMFLVVRSDSGPAFINAHDGSVGRLPENPSNLRFSPMHEGIQITGLDRMATIGTPPERVGALGMEGEGVEYKLQIAKETEDIFRNLPLVTSDYVDIVIDHSGGNTIPEVVTKPMKILPGDAADSSRRQAAETVEAFYDVFRRLQHIPEGRSRSLKELFPSPKYTVDDDVEDVRVIPQASPDLRRLMMHYSVGVPIAGLPRFLAHVEANTFVDQARQSIQAGRKFAEDLADGLGWPAGEHRDSLVGYLTLVYTQVDAEVSRARGRGIGDLAKNNAALVSRTPLADVRASLPEPVRNFLQSNETAIKEKYLDHRRETDKGITAEVFDDPLAGAADATIGDYLSSALDPNAQRISQDRALVVRTEFRLDHGGTPGNHSFDPPLLIVELRSYGSGNSLGTEVAQVKQRYEELVQAASDAYNHVRGLRGQDPDRLSEPQLKVPNWSSATPPSGGPVAPAVRQSHESVRGDVQMRSGRVQVESGQEQMLRGLANRIAQARTASTAVRLRIEGGGSGTRIMGIGTGAGPMGKERADAVWTALQPLLADELRKHGLNIKDMNVSVTSRGDGQSERPNTRLVSDAEKRRVLIWLSEPRVPTMSLWDVSPAAVAKSTDQTPCAGDPIDVTTGRMILTETDLTLPGLTLERTHRSDYHWGRSFGRSWASTLDQRVIVDGERVRYLAADGSILTYPLPAEGDVALPEVGRALPLCRLVGGGWLLTDPASGRGLLFDPASPTESLLSDVTDGGVRWSIRRDGEGTPTVLRSSTGATVELGSSAGLVTVLRLPNPAGDRQSAFQFDYDRDLNLVEVVNSSGDPERFDYADGRIVRWEDRNGEWYTYTYDESGRCVSTDGKGGYLRYRFDYQEGRTVVTDSLGAVRGYQLNDRFQVVAETDPLGATTRNEWDEAYRLRSRTDPLGRTTTYEYDADGRPTTVTRPDGSRSTIAYDELGRATSWTDFDGSTRNREFDADGRVLAEIDAAGEVVRFDRPTENGTAIQVGPTVVLRNTARQVTSVTTGDGETRYEYDLLGRAVVIEDDRGVTELGWTIEGELAWRANPDGGVEEFGYDGEGNLVESVDATGRRTLREYGAFDLVTAEVDDEGNRTEYTYDTELRLTTITNPAGETWRYTYDAAGRMLEETDFAGRTQRYAYDTAGQLTEHTNPAGETTSYTYDLLGRVVERRTGTAVTRLVYDAAGRIVGASDSDSEIRLERDTEGRVVSETVNGRTVSTSYSERFGTVTLRTRPSGAVTQWSYDESGRPVVLAAGGQQVRFGYAGGFEVSRTSDAGLSVAQTFDELGRLTAQRIDGVTDRRYTYDRTDRLIAVHDDVQGDRKIDADGGRGDIRYTLDVQGRPVTRSDAAGEWQLTWGPENRLVGVTTPGGDRWHYRYDAFGRRIAKQRRGVKGAVLEETEFVWSGELLVEQHHRARGGRVTTTVWEYHPAMAHPVAQIADGQVRAIVTDGAGSPMDVVSLDGGRAGDPDTIPLRVGGRYLDAETGLRYDRFRYYDPATARFLPEPQAAPVPTR
ncbi:DUF6531 domain-containing protein [Rhizomonospora bruguierae]|uniref:DUF6531 domain-containing protein n=1 Tax=Rhizomonospora bruguierae TaxID=1581705 RepID=UPI001BCE57D5|nr:DUF6531 domain-containing protein [Micromonospora sp. NBRC 107566]